MKKLLELTETELETIRRTLFQNELKIICEVGSTYRPELTKEIEEAFKEAEDLQTPWFLEKILMESPAIVGAIKENIEEVLNADNTFFTEREDVIIRCN